MMYVLILLVTLIHSAASAQELLLAQAAAPRLEWGMQAAPVSCATATPNTMVQRASSATGPYSTVATLPITTTTWNLPVAVDNLYYRVATACGQSNVVQYVAPPSTGLTLDQRMTAVETKNAVQDFSLASLASGVNANVVKNTEQDQAIAAMMARLTILEAPVSPPSPTSNLTVRQIDADHIEITCNGIGISTSGSGTRRLMECRH